MQGNVRAVVWDLTTDGPVLAFRGTNGRAASRDSPGLDPLTQLLFLPAMLAMTRQSFALRVHPAALRRALLTSVAVLGAASLGACGGGSDGPTAPPGGGGGVASVTVSPSTATLAIGATTTLTATPVDASGSTVSGQTVTWSTGDASIATVTGGVVTGKATGTVTITAAAGGHQGQATITVGPAAVASVALAATQTSLLAFVADSVHLGTATVTATVKDAGGNVLTGRTVTWASSDTNVVQVSSSGVVQAISGGTATVTATSGGASGSIGFTVTNPTVAHIGVAPAYDTVKVGQNTTIDVRVYDANMNQIVSVSHNRQYLASFIATSINPSSGVVSLVPPSSNTFHGDAVGDAVVTFSAPAAGVGINAKITVIP